MITTLNFKQKHEHSEQKQDYIIKNTEISELT